MSRLGFEIDPEVSRAQTPPARFYRDAELHALVVERVFGRSWQMLADTLDVPDPRGVLPVTLLPGSLDEPLVVTRDDGQLRALSNVCTHRALCVAERASAARDLRCRYHGRRFGLDGRFLAAPGFEGAQDFPRPEDDLRGLQLERRGPWLFTSLDPSGPFDGWWGPIARRNAHLPWERLTRDRSRDRDFVLDAHWALYVENYLEGLHIPFIHPGLTQTLELGRYDYELFDSGVLQLGEAGQGDVAFESPPEGHPDAGRSVAAWYWWLFPNLMVNVYPWGVSTNVIEPLGPARTQVRFRSYVWDPSKLDTGAGGDLVSVELEDEQAAESVQRGLASRLYGRGRYAPAHERGTHRFHRLVAAAVEGG
ncbi:aromatic ring-hydroxylating oxygenase subunit alpha [Engelhardtia mirabilis]|uniref:3-phenylpropionate/cinnamic acid dioxygenase subunit alpha n=1 Tax=Engelhardtia mirabilis TaxID=2528011 RepID=A0A518BHJ3_9BACT|nr:3-phenylpropionate/cinnamic acid dioxygenase subunit alpha [Planctomycetes bacterium Pla133]QDV00777.1 3-phenylpropionate/cinnamic acid dioxygenase subunit alpha [Planctomycetes bacterium Pla86]